MNELSCNLNELNRLVLACGGGKRGIVAACVGTDSVLGDCLGPVVGQMLTDRGAGCYVYGTLSNPITALNADEYSLFIHNRHPDALIIAVDSCVGLKSDLGKIRVSEGKLYPAAALNKKLLGMGDISVTAIVSDSLPDKPAFSSVRLGFVYSLAGAVASLISDCIHYHNYTAKARDRQSLSPAFSIRV